MIAKGRAIVIGSRPTRIYVQEKSYGDFLPKPLPADWIVVNAPRPLDGALTWTGDFQHGTFYAAVDPTSDLADWQMEQNRQNDAYPVEWKTIPQMKAALTSYYKRSYPKDYSAYTDYLDVAADREIAAAFQNMRELGGDACPACGQPFEFCSCNVA